MIRKTSIAFVALLSLGLCRYCTAQSSAMHPVGQPMAVLPANPTSLQIVDGSLVCYAADVVLRPQMVGNQIAGFMADTVLMRLNDNVESVQRHPSTGDLYFVARNKKQVPRLYVYPQFVKRPKAKEVELPGFEEMTIPIENPVFTDDGTIMIFASTHPSGRGGYDLWFSELKSGVWQRPQNLGTRINTAADELSPSIYRQYLVFSSRGHLKNHSNLNVYVTRLLSDQVIGDTVGMLQIGRNPIQRLPEPVNTEADNYSLVIDTATELGFWLSSSGGHTVIKSFQGPLQGLSLWGQVTDRDGRPVDGVTVSAVHDGKTMCHDETNLFGFYQLFLMSGQNYDIRFSKPNRCTLVKQVSTMGRDDGENLLSTMQYDACIDSLPIGHRLVFADLFDYDASTELSARGRESLMPLVRFLCDNPTLDVELTVYDDLTDDVDFNSLLTQSRLATLENYLAQSLPPTVGVTLKNGTDRYSARRSDSKKSQVVVIISATGKE